MASNVKSNVMAKYSAEIGLTIGWLCQVKLHFRLAKSINPC